MCDNIKKENNRNTQKDKKKQEKTKIQLDTVFYENKQLKQELKAVRKANKGAVE